MRKNGTLPARLNQVHHVSSGNPGQAWSSDQSLKTRSLGRRESHPMYNHSGNKSVSPSGAMNGHCSQGVVCNTQVPGPVDNVPLVEPETRKVSLQSCSFANLFSYYNSVVEVVTNCCWFLFCFCFMF